MAVHSLQTLSPPQRLLPRAMRANGVFSLVSGLAATFAAEPIAQFMGIQPSTIILVLGIGLIIFGVDLLWITSRPELDDRWGIAAITLDILWIIGSAAVLIIGTPALSTAGQWTVMALADIVAIFAAVQAYGVWQLRR